MVTLKNSLIARLKDAETEKAGREKDIEELQEEIELVKKLIDKIDKNKFKGKDTKLSADDGEDLRIEVMALQDIIAWHKHHLEEAEKEARKTKAKLEILAKD